MLKLRFALGFLLCACASHERDENEAANTTAAAKITKPQPSEPEPDPEPAEPYVPRTPLGPTTVTPTAFQCPELPDRSSASSAAIARVLRRLACEPELFMLSQAELSLELGLPTGKVSFATPTKIRVVYEQDAMPRSAELAAALGIQDPVVGLQWLGTNDLWYLGNNPDTGALDRFGPGAIRMQVMYWVDETDPPQVERLTAEMDELDNIVTVEMPPTVVQFGPDTEGVTQLVTAVQLLAARPALFAEDPSFVAKTMKLEGERFGVSQSIFSRPDRKVYGFGIGIARTVIGAEELTKALGLMEAQAAVVHLQNDEWQVEVDGTTSIPWKGVVLEIDVEPREKSEPTATLFGATVEEIRLLASP